MTLFNNYGLFSELAPTGTPSEVTDYDLMINKPKINNIVLHGNKTGAELELLDKFQGLENKDKMLGVNQDGFVIPVDGATKAYVDQEIANAVNEANAYTNTEIYKPEHTIMTVTAMKEGIGFKSDYTATEIKQHVDGGGAVFLRFNAPDGSGEQSYPYETFKDNYAIFRRPQVDATNNSVSRIVIKIDNNYNVSKEEDKIGVATSQDIQDLDADKLGVIRYTIQNDRVSQKDALDILSNSTNYEGQLIEFLTNGSMPNKSVALGFIMTSKNRDTYLLTYNLDGTTTQWNRDYYEKHNFEAYSFINKTIDLDSLTLDVRGEAPYIASVQKATNKPTGSGDFGVVVVVAYSIDRQIQIYKDMETGLSWTRIITGLADRHSFDTWKPAGVTKEYVDTELGKRALIPRIYENSQDKAIVLPNVMPSSVYKFGVIDSLTINNIPDSPLKITFIFSTGSSKPTINFPVSLGKVGFTEFQPSKKYIVTIENNIAFMSIVE